MLSLVTEKGCKITICDVQRLDYTSSLFYDLRILKLPDKVKLKTAEIMYKAFNNSLPNNIKQSFSFCMTLSI